ncbi:hypothetical protein L228DRAFT_247327 [Xylona heveae TC161]|uniref:RING-type domain-containing protein n=1 Tax=Xylona heveae (strain CBS 132557 / TC161) TaxID=1328760 RepID=A0A165H2W5_XYLHT|nr:hypothetical protein L228DRAFT_247327 [Xylona heveae TC161]KZF22911.1 hypothetical protein L228DRAFT_247327 [Xylona heveae TC161]
MATLTANTPRLPEHCPHKLPTSCLLTATPLCCACADRRSHSSSYSVYIDGVGFVRRATRWQRYCWMCKEFWDARIDAASPPIPPSQTRIPDIPDQSEFLERWYDHHRGYRRVQHEDGSEGRIEVTGEPLQEVAPGRLPRSLEELREAQIEAERREAASSALQREHESETAGSLSSALSAALDEIRAATGSDLDPDQDPDESAEDVSSRFTAIDRNLRRRHGDQAIYITALRRELEQLRSSTERVMASLHGLGERAEESAESLARSDSRETSLGRLRQQGFFAHERRAPSERPLRSGLVPTVGQPDSSQVNDPMVSISSIQNRLDAANAALERARRARERAADDLEASESNVQAARERVRELEREHRTVENYTRTFGSREEVERQGADYESPITGMFNRAWGRYREREEEQRRDRILREIVAAEEQVMEGTTGEPSSVAEANRALEETRFNNEADDDDDMLNEYYAGLRAQGWSQMPWARDVPVPQTLSPTMQSGGHSPHDRNRNESSSSTATANQTLAQDGLFVTRFEPRLRELSLLDSPSRESLLRWLRIRASARFDLVNDHEEEESEPEGERKGLDNESSGRPPPKESEELTVNLECKICYTQLADTVVLPCGHLVMCQWCADMHVPPHRLDKTRPATTASCPLCRKKVKQRALIYRG